MNLIRMAALEAALKVHGQPVGLDELRRTADVLAAWLGGTTRLSLAPGPITDEGSTAQQEGTIVQITTGQKVSYTADTEDASGFDTVESIEWVTNEPTIITLKVSEDTRSCEVVSGAPGSAVLTARISSLGLEVTEAIDVVPAGTATIKLVAGDVVSE
ncbi:hypothetical protein FHR32_000291 [Streptosporangium album]|uniref:Uncharacterized protein n=1 Tax=Streptosporangium album TaxID=47479 RepID=A0A7W7W6P6_9ACTN|nr:hypothetical protein [Streptosporangium album]MBB4935986.1 hypothetical protein [Streptosporangium album]